jgi:hypothetical protein
MRLVTAVTAFVAVLAVGASAQQPTGTAGTTTTPHVMTGPGDVHWGPAPDAFPAGAELAVLDGDPATGPFTVRLKAPDGYRVPPHWHPTDENVTVLEGTLMMGMGEQFSEDALRPIVVGGFANTPQGVRHYVVTQGPTVIQISGIGPFAITYVNSSDDPRTKK